MKKPLALLLILAALFCGGFAPRTASAAVSFDFFYESLEPYGEWLDVGDYGYCWHPRGVDANWAPYTDGYWAYTDAGWTWVSYEDFGGITYHYGRWVDVDDEGWCWVPDYEWAPAWVSWRSSKEHVGWAPLPPRAHFVATIGISTWADREYDIGPRYYNFCAVRDFGSPALRPVIIDRSRNVAIINNTVNITNITVNGDRNIIYNGGPQYELMARRSARPIQTLRLVQNTEVNANDVRANRFLARQQGNQLIVAAPQVQRPSAEFKPKQLARVIQNPKVDTGWNKIKDPKVRQDLRQRIAKQQTAKPAEAPAKPVDPQALKIVEEKAKGQAGPNAPERVVGGKEGRAAARNANNPAAAQQAVANQAAKAAAAQARADQKVAQEAAAAQAQTQRAAGAKGKNAKGHSVPAITAPPAADGVPPSAGNVANPPPSPPQALHGAKKPGQRSGGQPSATPQPAPPSQGVVPNQKPVAQKKNEGDDAARRALQQQRAAALHQQNAEAAATRQRALQQQQQQGQQREAARENAIRKHAAEQAPNPDAIARQRAVQQQQQGQQQTQKTRVAPPQAGRQAVSAQAQPLTPEQAAAQGKGKKKKDKDKDDKHD